MRRERQSVKAEMRHAKGEDRAHGIGAAQGPLASLRFAFPLPTADRANLQLRAGARRGLAGYARSRPEAAGRIAAAQFSSSAPPRGSQARSARATANEGENYVFQGDVPMRRA